MQRLISGVFAILLVLLIDASGAEFQTNTVHLKGLHGSVTVRRDDRWIPYISANSDDDLYFAQGYVTASDRLWQMDLLRRVALGKTAEIFGKQTLEEDKRWRRFGFEEIAGESLQYLSPELRRALDSYAKGVNAYMSGLDEKSLPVEFRILQYRPAEWKATDTVVIGKILADALSSTWRSDILKASLRSLPKEKFAALSNQVTPYDVVLFGKDSRKNTAAASSVTPTAGVLAAAESDEIIRETSLARIGLNAEELAASNDWVIAGSRTADGKPILANDPHLQPSVPGIWYLTHLSTPSMRVSGVTFPGVPGIVLGHNGSIAWGATNVGPDVQDVYLEHFGADGKYMVPGGSGEPKVRNEEIRVRTNPMKPDTEIVSLAVQETRNGVVIAEDKAGKYALRWTARDPKNSEFEAFYFLNRASNWQDFTNALQNYGGATQNFVYADVKGNIGWYAAGKIPIRRTGDGSLPYDGATNAGDWTGFIPFAELPHLFNPTTGLIVTANQRTVGTDYPYPQFIRDAASPWRARRIFDLLASKRKITVDDVRDVQYDTFNIPLANLSKQIIGLSAASPETLALLKDWDGRMTADSRAALRANEIRNCLADKIAAENPPAPAALIRERVLDKALGEQEALWLPKTFTNYKAFVMACDAEVTLSFSSKYGSDPAKWVWAAVSQSRFAHPLASIPFLGGQFAVPSAALSGSGQSPNVMSFVSMRHITSPANWDNTRQVIPMGQSGDPASPHYKDQFDLWKSGASAIFPFSKAAVEAVTKASLTLEP